jgi:indole-3-glycerol phosphate synthase
MGRPADILVEIVARRRERLAGERTSASTASGTPVGEVAPPLPDDHPFLAALGQPGRSVIAEVKLGSPRLGDLRERLDPEHLAATYAESGAAAISVVVEPDYFHGSYEFVTRCGRAAGLPVLAKDFLVSPVQLEWAAEAGAAAVLLIAALLEPEELRGYAAAARQLGLVPLIETHDRAELESLRGSEWEAVGVNNRDLRTFDVDLGRSAALLPGLPAGCLKVAESGLRRSADLERLEKAGFDAFLIGESLLTAEDPAAKLRQLVGRTDHEESG